MVTRGWIHVPSHNDAFIMHTHTNKSHQHQRWEAVSDSHVMKLLCIHTNHLFLNYWSGPYFSLLFLLWKGEGGEGGGLKIACERQSLEVFPCSPSLAALEDSDEPALYRSCVSMSRAHPYTSVQLCTWIRHKLPYCTYALKHIQIKQIKVYDDEEREVWGRVPL